MTLEQLEAIENPTIDDFIQYYDAIPEEEWCMKQFVSYEVENVLGGR